MVRTVWALVQGTRRLYLVDDTCMFLEPVKRYLEALDIQGKSPNTQESYCRHLKHYFTFLEEARLDWRAVTPDDLLRFVEWLRNPHRLLQVHPLHVTSRLSERSVNTILAAIASFYRYQVQRGQVLTNPVLYEEVSNRFSRFKPFLVHTSRGKMTRRGLKLKEPQRRIRPVGDEAFARFQDETHNVQFQCILLLMRDGGLRVGEVLGLHIQDLEFHRNDVVIRRRAGLANGALAKGMVEHEERFVELTPQVMALLDHLVLQHTFETDHVFVVRNLGARNQRGESTYGTPLSRHALKALFRYYSQKSGIPLHAHLLRHTHATELIRAGWDASYVQQRLGHANVQTTINTYVHLDDDDLSQKWQAYQERRVQHVRPTPQPADLPRPLEQLTKTQQRFVPLLLDPTTRHLPVHDLVQRAGLRSSASWYLALRDEAFRAWVEQLGRRCPPPKPSVADAFAGLIPVEQGLSVAQQRFWRLLQDPDNRKLSRLELCRQAGYTTDRAWYESVQDPAFRAWVRSLGIKCTMITRRAYRLDAGPIPLAEDVDAEWAQDRIDIRRITSDYPKHKNGGEYVIDFSCIQNPALKALMKRYFRARVGSWSGHTIVVTLSTLKPVLLALERRYPGFDSFASLTRDMLEPVLAMTGWIDSMERYHEVTRERRHRVAAVLKAMFTYMQRHQWPEAPQQFLIYDEDFPKRIRLKPRPIPAMVMEQLLEHREALPPYSRHLLQIMSVMGLRTVDALHLTEDCLEYDATGDPRVRWYNVKMKREVRPLPVTKEVEAAIFAQRELVKEVPDVHGKRYLFRTANGLHTYKRFCVHLNVLARQVPILGPDGQIFRFRPHEIRHTVGTDMINNGMGLADVMTYLDHQSPEMTRNYALIYDETLKRKFKELVLSGRAVGGLALHALREQITTGDESELDWVVANLRKLSLPWGQCLHHAKAPKCPYGQNMCFTKDNGPCHKLVTTPEHAPVIVATLEDLRKSRQVAEEHGWELYANDLGDQIHGVEQVFRELELPADERPKNRGGRKATNETEH